MVYAEAIDQPSWMLRLAQTGDFRAISYLINSYLRPQGIHARVAANQRGCLHVLVEFQQEPIAERIVRFICHLLWNINSPTVEGVRVVGRFTGQPDVLWKRSVRIGQSRVTTPPATSLSHRIRQSLHHYRSHLSRLQFKTLRAFLMLGSAVASFIVGCWVSYAEVAIHHSRVPTTAPQAIVTSAPPSKRSDTVQAALETVPVIQHTAIQKPQDPSVTLVFGGDVALSDAFEETVGEDYEWAFEQLEEYREADLAMVNLENPLTRSTLRRPNKQFNFKADPEAVQVLQEGGIDIVNLANNHAMDYKESGLAETLKTLNKADIHAVGAGRDLKQARRPEIIEVKGQRIAYFGYYDDADAYTARTNLSGTNPIREEWITEDIQAIRDQVDWIVVNFHWGVELAEYPSDWQIDLARFTIDQGADVIIGHHPHVLQGAEVYRGRPIVYSLGNFIFGGNSRSNYDTAVLKVALRDNRQMKVEFLPIEVKQYQAKVAQGQTGSKILRQIEKLSLIFERPMSTTVVLDGSQRTTPVRVATAQPTLTEPTLPQIPQAEQPETGQESAADLQSAENESQGASAPSSQLHATSPAARKPIPAPSPISEAEALKPYIQEPFVVDPFILLPQLQTQPKSPAKGYDGDVEASFSQSFPTLRWRTQGSQREGNRTGNLDRHLVEKVKLPFQTYP